MDNNKYIMDDNTNIIIKRTIKNLINGKKKYNNAEKDKAIEYFKQSLDLLSELKNRHNDKIIKHKNLINDTETECKKYLSLSIESSIKDNKNIDIIKLLYDNLRIGNLNEINKFKCKEINFSELINNNTILHWAINFGDSQFLIKAFKLGGRIDTTNKNGNTLLEYACLEQDPNMIEILNLFGANMQKHLYFRNGTFKYITRNDSIDINILIKIILSYIPESKNLLIKYKNTLNNIIYNKIKLLINNINLNEKININEYTFNDLFDGLLILLNNLPLDSSLTYINIIKEELSFKLKNNLGCPPNILEIILVNLVPFIDYPFNISIDWVISLELKHLLLRLIKKYNDLNIKEGLINELNIKYINNGLLQEDYLGCLISQWISKIKV